MRAARLPRRARCGGLRRKRVRVAAPHAGVHLAALKQLFVRAAADDAPGVHDEDLVGPAHGGQAVRDGDERLAGHQLADGALHQCLVLGVGVGRRLVEDDDGRALQDGARDSDALLLAAGKPLARLAGARGVALRQTAHELVAPRRARSGLHLGIACRRAPHADVVGDGAVEQKRVLGHVGHVLHKLLERYVPHVHASERHATRRGVPEPGHELRHGRLART